MSYRTFFGFQKEPFSHEIRVEELYPLPGLKAATERFMYSLELGAVSIVTGDVGSGKSTALRYAASKLHPSRYKVISLVGSTGSIIDIMRLICSGFDAEGYSNSLAKLTSILRAAIVETAQRKQTPVLIVDEASLMRLEIFSQLHAISQFEMDSKPLMPMVLAGQNNLIDKLMFHTSRPLASRVIGRSYMEGLKHRDMAGYIRHHLEIAGIKEQLFSEEAVLAIHQGSWCLLRRANLLAKGALVAAANEKSKTVSAEHARMASTEVI